MKLITTATTISIQAETIAEAIQLLALTTTPPIRTKHTYIKKKKSAWKGKHRIPCPTCHKKFKNLKLHNLKKHDNN